MTRGLLALVVVVQGCLLVAPFDDDPAADVRDDLGTGHGDGMIVDDEGGEGEGGEGEAGEGEGEGEGDTGSAPPCWRCAGGDFMLDSAFCGVEEVAAADDGSCPEGSSAEPPDCAPCWDCRVGNAYCQDAGCCGTYAQTGVVGAGCTCYGCSGDALQTSPDAATSGAEADSHAGCSWPSGTSTTFCGYHQAGCWIASCGTAAECG